MNAAVPAVELQLRLASDSVHLGNRFLRVVAHRRFRRQHDSVAAVQNGAVDVIDLRPGRLRMVDHRLEHLGRGDRWDAEGVGLGDDRFLDSRDLLARQRHPEVSAGDENRVGGLQDLLQVMDARAVLDLGDDEGLFFPPAREVLAHLRDFICGSDEGHGDHIETHVDAKLRVLEIIFIKNRELELRVGKDDALAAVDRRSPVNLAEDLLIEAGDHLELDLGVIQEDSVSRLNKALGSDIVHSQALGRDLLSMREDDLGSLFEDDGCCRARPSKSHLVSLQVLHDRDRPACFFGGRADFPDQPLVGLLGSVREIKPRDVHARCDEALNYLAVRAGWSQGADDPAGPRVFFELDVFQLRAGGGGFFRHQR